MTLLFLPILGDQIRLGVTRQIHGDIHKVASGLAASGHDVIVQQYELRNPDYADQAMNDGIRDLNGFGWRDFGGGPAIQVIGPQPYIGVKRHCTISLKGILCGISLALMWTPVRIVVANKVPRTSFALTKENFPAVYYVDQVHFNPLGCQAHAMYLNYELKQRCWW